MRHFLYLRSYSALYHSSSIRDFLGRGALVRRSFCAEPSRQAAAQFRIYGRSIIVLQGHAFLGDGGGAILKHSRDAAWPRIWQASAALKRAWGRLHTSFCRCEPQLLSSGFWHTKARFSHPGETAASPATPKPGPGPDKARTAGRACQAAGTPAATPSSTNQPRHRS